MFKIISKKRFDELISRLSEIKADHNELAEKVNFLCEQLGYKEMIVPIFSLPSYTFKNKKLVKLDKLIEFLGIEFKEAETTSTEPKFVKKNLKKESCKK